MCRYLIIIEKASRLQKRIVNEIDELYMLRRNITTIRNLFHTFMFYILKSTYLYSSRVIFFFHNFFFPLQERPRKKKFTTLYIILRVPVPVYSFLSGWNLPMGKITTNLRIFFISCVKNYTYVIFLRVHKNK